MSRDRAAGAERDDPYDQLAELARQELQLVEAGDLDAVTDLHARRGALIATLPASPPPHALAALEHATAAHRRTAALLATAHSGIATELHHLHRGRRAARSYAPADAATQGLDRSA
jgi:hypothetical protein